MTNEEIREAFEQRFADHAWFNPYSMDGDSYLDGSTNLAWEVWKAAAQALREPLEKQVAMLVDALTIADKYMPIETPLDRGDTSKDVRTVNRALDATQAEVEAFIREKQAEAFKRGWIAAAKWAERDNLIADIGSPAYMAELRKAKKEE